ncbi:MAG: DUF4349 domain-containing protein [Spirochaetales bacterium]|nr:DUF4349 domain-containing protein [Spirochaetales bacterium]
MKHRSMVTALAVLGLIAGLGSCSAKNAASDMDALGGLAFEGGRGMVLAEASPAAKSAPTGNQAPAEPAASDQAGRKLVYTASMDIEAADPSAVEATLVAAVTSAGGYVETRTSAEYRTWLSVRVPVAQLEPIMAKLAGSGRQLSSSLSADDVTDSYFDLEGRLRNKRLLEERYRSYLRSASSIEDILAVERSLSDITTEIEWMEGSFRDLSQRIQLASLSVTITPERVVDPSKPSLGKALSTLFSGLGDVLRVAVVAVVGLLVYGVPAVLLAALLWWLCFGRLGLVKKLFSLVRGGKAGRA